MIHTVKGFGIVNKVEVDVFLELSCFFHDPADIGNLISGSSAFSKTSLNIRKFMVHILLKLGLRILSITLLEWEMSAMVQKSEHSLALPFFGIRMKIDLFQSCGHCCVFQIWWHIEYSTFTASSFRIWNSSAGIPLALFIVTPPKAYLTLHSKMSGSRWVITPLWLSESWRSFLYSSSVYSCLIFLISSVLLVPYHFCPLLAHLCMKCSLGISNFLEEISALPISIFSPLFLYIFHLGWLSYLSLLFFGTLHSDGYIFPFLLCL